MSSNMNRRPSLFLRMPPSPRTPSVTRIPRTLGGQTMPVGWNCMNSMSIKSAPTSATMVHPSPVYSQEFDVTFQALPPPPVASTTALHLSLIHISEPTRQAEISYAAFCLKKKKHQLHPTSCPTPRKVPTAPQPGKH